MAAADDFKILDDAVKAGQRSVTLPDGRTFTLEEARTERDRLGKELEAKKSAKTSEQESKNRQIANAQKSVQNAESIFNQQLRAFNKNNASAAEVERARLNLQSRQEFLARLTSATVVAAPVKPGYTISQVDKLLSSSGQGIVATEEPTPPPPPTGTSAGKPGKKITKSDVDAALVAANLTDTPENRKKVREQLKAGKPIKPSNWEALVAEQAGEYAYLLGPEFEGVPELLRKAVEQDWFSSEQGKAQFLQELKKTPYGLNTSTKQQQFDLKTAGNKKVDIQANIDRIRTQYGEIQFDQATLEEIAGTAARNGASDIELGRLVYRAAFKRGAVSPDLTSPIAAKTALGGDDAARIKAIYRSYGVRADDEQVARILAGQPEPTTGIVMTEDMLRTNLRDLAKVSYQPFADLLDRGLSVQTIFSPYQQIAASTLEKSVNNVALTDANGTPTQFASALMGEKPMSLTDWITKLKSDDRYGWQFTSEAKQQASNLVMELEKAFGYRK